MKQSLSPKELAEAIGVSESSLKRWADTGRVRVTRTMGGHRRIPIQEAVRFARESQLPIVRPDVLGIEVIAPDDGKANAATAVKTVGPDSSVAEVAGQLEDLFQHGKADAARGLLLDLYLKGRPLSWLCDGPIRTAMSNLGKLWEQDRRGIFLEHQAVDVCIHTLTQIRLLIMPSRQSDGPPPTAVGGTPPGDPYLLGSLMSACVLAEAGFRDVNLGADMPLDALLEAARHYEPRLVWLSCSSRDAVPSPQAIDRLANQLSEINAKLVVGGQVSPRGGGQSDNVHACGTMAELSAFASGLRSA